MTSTETEKASLLLDFGSELHGGLKLVMGSSSRRAVSYTHLAECNPDKNLQSNKDAFIEELLRERACELGMEDARFFDSVSYTHLL